MFEGRTPISAVAQPLLERALQERIQRRAQTAGSLGELEPLAVRLGLMQGTLQPRFRRPRLLVFAADHGLAVDGLPLPPHRDTPEQVRDLLSGRVPVAAFARMEQVGLTVVDCGIADDLPANERLWVRKIAHGTRNSRVGAAMSLEQAHAALRAGFEIGDSLSGNALMLAGIGLGSHESAALMLSRLARSPVRDLLHAGPSMNAEQLAHLMIIAQAAHGRHREAADAIDVLSAFGGFEIAMMTGTMLAAASRRSLLIVDGIAACAALMVAARIAPAITDYCVFCRSRVHAGLDHALALFGATALLELGLDSLDGTGAVLSWSLVRHAAALLSEVPDADEPSVPAPLSWSGPAPL